MTELLTAAQMRAIDQAAIESGEVTGLELMERAGAGVVEAVFEEWPELADGDRRAVVLCGPGNNGGDGFVVARLLKERGWAVEAFLYGDPEKLPPDAKVNYERWSELGNTNPMEWALLDKAIDAKCHLTVDAVFGTGLSKRLRGSVWHELFHALHDGVCHENRPNVAVDIPTGRHPDTGGGHAFPASLTVTFHTAKPGHFLGHNTTYECGKIKVCDIGLGKRWLRKALKLVDQDSTGLSFLEKDGEWDHKYTHGHALILSGTPGKGGAARLAARGALRIGAGLVTVGCPPAALQENAAQLTAIMLTPIDGAGGLTKSLQDERINALCLGPGLGLDSSAEDVVAAALQGGDRRVVFDADALTILARNSALFNQLNEGYVLTPHAGEFARLFPDIAKKLDASATSGPAYSKVDATREAAARAGCTVLFKGPDTVIADETGRCSINSAHYERAAPWLATAGSGDVLAGFITGLLARGSPPMQAAETAAWLHVECALKFGPGLIAEDIPEQLPAVFRDLGI